MRKSKLLLYFSLLILVLFSITNVNASENVKIKSIELIDKSVNASETSKATFDGLTMNFNIRFLSVDDYAKYKVVVENNESSDYKISIDSEFNNSKYIIYEYEKTDSLKANSESEFYVTVSYKNEVSESDFSNGKYNEKNSAVLKLSNGNINNPKTSNNMIMIIIGLVVMCGVLLVLFRNKKTRKICMFILFGLFSAPLFVKAVDSLKITINSNVVIEEKYSVGYEVGGYIKAADRDKFDLSHAKCDDVAYDYIIYTFDGSISDESKYIHCYKAFYKGNNLYIPGETVTFDPDSSEIYSINGCGPRRDEDGNWIVGDDGNDIKFCNTIKKINGSMLYYKYDIYDEKSYGYKHNDDDNTVMKFSKAYDTWQKNGIISVSRGSTFIMPKHDVIFTDYPA